MPISRKSFVSRYLAAALITAAATLLFMAPSCDDTTKRLACEACRLDPTRPGCAELLPTCQPPTTTTTTTTSTTTTTTTVPPVPVPTPTPEPVPSTCVRQTSPSSCQEGLPGDFKDRVNSALSRASQCTVGSDCFIPNWQWTLVRTMEILEAEGSCTSYDLDSGNCWKYATTAGAPCLKRGLGSEMGIRDGLGKSEFYQPITTAQKARWADARSVCRPALDEEMLPQVRVYLEVTPTPPTPAPQPTPGGCSDPVPGPLARWEVKVHGRGPNWTTLDSTPLVGPDPAFCRAIGYSDGRRYCPPRTEGTPEAIVRACNEQVVGTERDSQGRLVYPKWYWNYGELPEGVTHDDNPYHLLVRPTMEGRATVCGQNGVCDGVSLP